MAFLITGLFNISFAESSINVSKSSFSFFISDTISSFAKGVSVPFGLFTPFLYVGS